VIVLEADEAVIKEKFFAQPEPPLTEEKLTEMLAAYAASNSEDSPTSVLALPALAEVEPLGPIEVRADTAVSSILSKARVYLGQPRNYGPSDEEIAAKKALEEAEAKRKADEAAAAEAARRLLSWKSANVVKRTSQGVLRRYSSKNMSYSRYGPYHCAII